MTIIKKILAICSIGVAPFVWSMDRKHVFPTYIKPAPVFLATSTQMIPVALPKTQIPFMQSTTWSTTASTAAPIAKFSDIPALSTSSPCIDSVKIKELSQFKSSFETQTIDQQIETLEKLNSTLKSGSRQLDFLEKKLKAVKDGTSHEASTVRSLQGTYDGIKCSLELVREQIESAAHIFASNLRQKRESYKDLDSKVVFVFETIALHDRLRQRMVPQAMLESCHAARQMCLTDIAITLEKKFKNQPDFFKNGRWENLCGSSEKEIQWQKLKAICSAVQKSINSFNLFQSVNEYKASLETLYQARLFFKNFAHQIDAMARMGSDFTGISSSETAPIHAGLKDYTAVVKTCIICLEQKMGAYSAARFIQTEATPACMSAINDAKIWDKYVTDARNFVVAHYHKKMAADDIMHACLQSGTDPTFNKTQLETVYEQVARRLVITSQTEHRLKVIGQSSIDEAYVFEHTCACQEIRDIGKCLADMVITLHSHIEHYCPDAKLRDVGAIAEEIANEAQNAERDRQRNRPVINQFCEFIGQALLQHNAYFSLATDLAGSYIANTGPLKFDLSKTDGHDIVGACIAQVEKIKKQQAEALQPASIGISTPATQQTTSRDALSEQLQKLKTQLDEAELPRSAVYKKAIQLTLERHGKAEVVERKVPAEVKEIIKQTGQNPQIFDRTESTPIANQIIDDSYKNIVDLSQDLMTAPIESLPKAQTDLVLTAVNLSVAAADQAQRGNYEAAMEYNVAAYAHKCAAEFIDKAWQSAKNSLNPLEIGNGVMRGAKAEATRAIIEEHADLAFAYAIIKDMGICSAETNTAIEAQIALNQKQDHLI